MRKTHKWDYGMGLFYNLLKAFKYWLCQYVVGRNRPTRWRFLFLPQNAMRLYRMVSILVKGAIIERLEREGFPSGERDGVVCSAL